MQTEGDLPMAKRHSPFKSKAQQRWAFATHKKWARGKAHATGEHHGTPGSKAAYARLPARKGVRKR